MQWLLRHSTPDTKRKALQALSKASEIEPQATSQKRGDAPQVLKNLVDVAGIEPATPCLQIRFRHFLKPMEFCWFQVIGYRCLPCSHLKAVET